MSDDPDYELIAVKLLLLDYEACVAIAHTNYDSRQSLDRKLLCVLGLPETRESWQGLMKYINAATPVEVLSYSDNLRRLVAKLKEAAP